MRQQAVCAAIVTAVIAACCGGLHASSYNNYVLLADALLHGHVWVTSPGPWIDALPFGDTTYIIEAPAPAIMLLPLVAMYGTAANQSLLGVVLCSVAVGALYSITQAMRLPPASRILTSLALLAGTDLLWCTSLGDVWFLAHVAAVSMTLLALRELTLCRRPALVALWACLAAESRFSMVLVLPVYLALLLWPPSFAHLRDIAADRLSARHTKAGLAYCAVVALFVCAWVTYNVMRWGGPADIGYTAWYHQDKFGSPTGSPFDIRYLSYELQSFFAAMPEFSAQFPFIVSPIAGLALELTSPFLVIACFANGDLRLRLSMWLCAALTAAPSLIYYANGFAQFGMRHALDFEPFLLVLCAAALRRRPNAWQIALVAYSGLVGLWGVWYWHAVIARPLF